MKKRVITIICSVVLLLSMTLSISADGLIIDKSMITGKPCDSINQVTRTCKYCHNYTATVYCTGKTGTYFDPVSCSIYFHGTCTIVERAKASANAYCSYCEDSYGWDWDNGGHVESCKHNSSELGILPYDNLCNYGPRA